MQQGKMQDGCSKHFIFLRHVVKRPYVIPTVIYPRPTSKLPPVMLPEEIMKLIDGVQNLKHRTILMLLYSTGMRVSEIAGCRIADIDSKNMRIKIVQGKGGKDRYTIMSEQVLLELRAYYLMYKPKDYLFNGYREGKRYFVRSIQHLMQKALIKVGLESKNYTIHTIRHSFATHLVDNGTDLHTIKELLGTWTFKGKHYDWVDSVTSKVSLEFGGTIVRESFANGRYFVVNVTSEGKLEMPVQDGKMIKTKFHGIEIEGYENVKKKYVKTQIGNHLNSGINIYEGVYDSTKKTITFDSEYESIPGMKTHEHILYIFADKNLYKFEYQQEEKGKYRKATEITFIKIK